MARWAPVELSRFVPFSKEAIENIRKDLIDPEEFPEAISPARFGSAGASIVASGARDTMAKLIATIDELRAKVDK